MVLKARSITVALLLLLPQISLANFDVALANAADSCNSSAYAALKPQRDEKGARDLMRSTSEGKKYAKWMKKYLKLISLCQAKAYMPDCKPASKIDEYHEKLEESKQQLEENMLNNYLCSAPYVNKLAANGTASAAIKQEIKTRVDEFLQASR